MSIRKIYRQRKVSRRDAILSVTRNNTRGVDIYHKLSNYYDNHEIPKSNIISCAADGAPSMMGVKTQDV